MQDPSQGVGRELLPHVHLLSTYRFPVLPNVHHNKIAEWLLSAPKIVRDQAPFYWSYLDRPQDGTIFLTWQPLDVLGINFSTDGYVWPPVETAFQLEVDGGFALEMYQHKSGYGPGEQFAMHARRRFRLMPSKYPNPAVPTPDPALWIIHYYAAEPNERVPSSMIQLDARAQSLLQTRMYLQTQGQIVQKEFMLHDRTNWPQIQFPRGQVRQAQFGMGATRTPQTMAYPPHQMGVGSLGPPSKRARTQTNSPQAVPPLGAVVPIEAQDDEEDTSRGDIFDHMTPREVCMSRYKQNHEWMEEIMSSPYSIGQILPVDLGLGLRGELAPMTNGIFQAPIGLEDAQNGYTGSMDPEKAEEFRKRVAERISDTNTEMERMKIRHAKRLEKFKRGALVVQAEIQLRTAVHDPADIGPEYWRLEGKVDESEDADDLKRAANSRGKVDDIVTQVEVSLGRSTVAVEELKRIQDGGLEESKPVESVAISRQASNAGSQRSGVMIDDGDLDMGGSAAGLLDQFHTGFSSASTPGNGFPTPQPLLNTTSDTGTPVQAPSPQLPAQPEKPLAELDQNVKTSEDVEMGNTSKEGHETSDWVVVPKGGGSPPTDTLFDAETDITFGAEPSTTEQVPATEDADDNTNLDLDLGDNFNTDSNDFGSLDGLDTAGEALAGYGSGDMEEHGGDLGGDLDLGMDMGLDDSAFGDAFHGVEPRDGDGEGDGL